MKVIINHEYVSKKELKEIAKIAAEFEKEYSCEGGNMEATMTVKEVAKKLGKSETFIREGLARGLLPFGTGYAISGKRRSFIIFRKKFEEYVGSERNEISF